MSARIVVSHKDRYLIGPLQCTLHRPSLYRLRLGRTHGTRNRPVPWIQGVQPLHAELYACLFPAALLGLKLLGSFKDTKKLLESLPASPRERHFTRGVGFYRKRK